MRRRAVIVRRPAEFGELMGRYSMRGQVEFALRSRGHTFEPVERAHESHVAALAHVRAGIPDGWASADVERGSLSCFLFAPEGVIVVVGPDGLMANVAKYVDTQVVVGTSSVPESQVGVLVRYAPEEGIYTLRRLDEDADLCVDHFTMVQAGVDDSRSLRALNEVFTGCSSHQSACHESRPGSVVERQSFSDLVVPTGTGATGWGASLERGRHMGESPAPTSCSLAWFVHEAWPSPFTGAEYTESILDEGEDLDLVVASESPVLFDDGMESDRLTLTRGQSMRILHALRALSLVDPAGLGKG